MRDGSHDAGRAHGPERGFRRTRPLRLADGDIWLDRNAQLAKRTIPGASEVSVTLLQGDAAHAAAFTGELALTLDEKQYERGHGPCLNVSRVTLDGAPPETAWLISAQSR